MRIFIGIKMDAVVHERIERFLKPFKKMSTPIRWTKIENVHVTLKFIGDVPDREVKRIEERLGKEDFGGVTNGPLDIKLSGCGAFGKRGGLSIFWIGIDRNPGLKKLYHKIEDTIAPLGIEKETRPFKPHITVGRNKKNFNFKPVFKLVDERNGASVAAFTAPGFQVFKSDLRPEGPIYTILKEIPLNHGTA
jgi:2'-5' RNA ligase